MEEWFERLVPMIGADILVRTLTPVMLTPAGVRVATSVVVTPTGVRVPTPVVGTPTGVRTHTYVVVTQTGGHMHADSSRIRLRIRLFSGTKPIIYMQAYTCKTVCKYEYSIYKRQIKKSY